MGVDTGESPGSHRLRTLATRSGSPIQGKRRAHLNLNGLAIREELNGAERSFAAERLHLVIDEERVDDVAKVCKCRNPASGPQAGRGGTSRLLSQTEWVTRPNQPSVLVRIVSPVILLHNEPYENKEHPDYHAG
jgi:hypothetical protein